MERHGRHLKGNLKKKREERKKKWKVQISTKLDGRKEKKNGIRNEPKK